MILTGTSFMPFRRQTPSRSQVDAADRQADAADGQDDAAGSRGNAFEWKPSPFLRKVTKNSWTLVQAVHRSNTSNI
jgi:hypothetical protein